jgi:hypothetical protein
VMTGVRGVVSPPSGARGCAASPSTSLVDAAELAQVKPTTGVGVQQPGPIVDTRERPLHTREWNVSDRRASGVEAREQAVGQATVDGGTERDRAVSPGEQAEVAAVHAEHADLVEQRQLGEGLDHGAVAIEASARHRWAIAAEVDREAAVGLGDRRQRFATATRDPRLRRLHGADGPTLIEEWYLLENVPDSSIVGDFDADGWDDALVWTTFPVGAVAASFETGELRLGWSLSSAHPNAYMPGADGVPGRFFEVDPDALAVWTVGDPEPIEAPPLPLVGVQSIAVVEVDGDGRLDLVVSRVGRLDWLAQDGSDFVERGGGEIGFDADAVVSADVDADGRPELAVSRAYGVGFAIVRTGDDGALEVIWSNPDVNASPLAVADLDHDGRDDVLGVDRMTGVLRLVSLHAEGAWQERVIVAPEAEVARPFEVDGDGLLDVVIGENERLVILPGRG